MISIIENHNNRLREKESWIYNFLKFCSATVILQIFGVVLISVFSVVNRFTEIK